MKQGDRKWEEFEEALLIRSMVAHIGSTDSELRDKLIYTVFWKVIVEENLLNHDCLQELLMNGLNNLLFKDIEEKNTDSVFTRAFSSLLIALILYRDKQDNFLSSEVIETVKEKLISYMEREYDVRGYVSEKGWAHSVAHAADAFDELIKSPKLNKSSYPEVLRTLWKKVLNPESVYSHDEDERLLIPILEMLHRGLEVKKVEILVEQIPRYLQEQKNQLNEEYYWILVFNTKTFLKSLFFKLNQFPSYKSLGLVVEKCLKNL
ncbi:hypothetical protein Q75_11180 [Bacillus coahuilensis p1.1.43]|uniref:DUF2785 domain-containing protein n=1 Tax=Bacillus coahuilensis p1.1.43 TaxID=1150625 RepID=A0A147K6W1_9BACI|nr:hypothetical protein Q75_11180 [Bacillus coahuilensis p1.1.43]